MTNVQPNKNLHFILSNVRSLLPKIDEVKILLSVNEPKLIFFTETWLKNCIPDNILEIDGYNFIRKDRTDKRGGGLLIYYKSDQRLNCFNLDNIPSSCENLSFTFNSIIYILFYFPPCTPTIDVETSYNIVIDKIDQLLTSFPSYNICILGDFNRFSIKDLCNNLDLKNLVTDFTRHNAILDYCLVSRNLSYNLQISVKDPIGKSDHNTIFCFNNETLTKSKNKRDFYDFRQSNLVIFRTEMSKINWDPIYYFDNVDVKCDFFTNAVKYSMRSIPKYNITNSANDKQWITPLCKHLINERWKAFRVGNWAKYNHLKDKVKIEIRKAKILWYQKCKRKRGGLWDYIKKSCPSKKSNIISLKDENESVKELCDRINIKLSESFSNSQTHNTSTTNSTSIDDCSILFTPFDVFIQMSKLKSCKATGSDNLPNLLLKFVADIIAQPLCHIFNFSLDNLSFPKSWKICDISPLAKSNPISIEKLRPISLLPNVSKIFEKLLLEQLLPYFFHHIGRDQFGFMPKSSTSACLIHIHDTLTNYLDQENVLAVSLVSYDLQRAFDSIPHDILLRKLYHVLPHNICLFLSHYLSHRYQRVKISNSYSNLLHVSSGVPQGGILSPLLFNVFINDLDFENNCKIFKYADDTTLVIPHYNNTITKDIDTKTQKMVDWCSENHISLNKSKTQIVTIRKNKSVSLHNSHQKNIKILGVYFNEKLKWDKQIEVATRKACQKMHIIRKLNPVLQHKDVITLYKALVDPVLQYGSELYVLPPIHLRNKINAVYKRCLKIICTNGCRCIESPDTLRSSRAINLYVKASVDEENKLYCIIPSKLPKTKHFSQPFSRTERRKLSFIPTVTEMINSIQKQT